MIVNNSSIDSAMKKLDSSLMFVLDVETTGLDILGKDRLCGIGIGIPNREVFYFPFRHSSGDNLDKKWLDRILSLLEGKVIIGHNIKYDIKALYSEGFNYDKCYLIDTMVMIRLSSTFRDPGFALEKASEDFLGSGRGEYKKEFKKYLRKNKIKNYSEGNLEIVGDYCNKDVLNTYDLYLTLNRIIKFTGQEELWKKECQVTKTLLNMEICGIKVDLSYCKKCVDLLSQKSEDLTKEIHVLAGKKFNIDSHKQLTEILEQKGIESSRKTKTGKDSWRQAAMVLLEDPICKKVMEYRTTNLLKRTFFEPLIKNNKVIVNTSFKNWGTITGRLSCEEPNLQNIPRFTRDMRYQVTETSEEKQKFINRMVASTGGGSSLSSWAFEGDEYFGDEHDIISARRLFVPRENKNLFSLDFVQMEVIVFLYYVKEYELLEKIAKGNFDYHSWVAIEALGANEENPDFKFIRQIAKGITFGIIYGMGLNTLSIQIGKTKEEAEMFRNKYFERIPKAKEFIQNTIKRVESGEIIYNAYNRRYCLPPQLAYKIVNYLVQGTAGEIIKENMVEIDKFLRLTKSNLLVQIHDELLFEIDVNEEHILKDIVNIMKRNSLNVPMSIDVAKCEGSWASKKEYVL